MTYSLKDFLAAFAAEHALTSGGEMVIDVSPDELAALGDFFLRGVCGWALGLEADRTRPRLVEVTRPAVVNDERASDENASEDTCGIDEGDEEKEQVN